MAYVDFQDVGGGSATRQPSPVEIAREPTPRSNDLLTTMEWVIVEMARKDAKSSLRRPGPITILLRIVLSQPNPMLTDPRLEALRRIAVLTWQRGYSIPSHEVRTFLDAGFTAWQYETIANYIGDRRIKSPRNTRHDGYKSAAANHLAALLADG